LKPGTYEMYLTTRRVFPWDTLPQVYTNSEWTTASNMLKIRILPDPGWQDREFAKIQANPRGDKACFILARLDIPAATAEKLENRRNGDACSARWAFNESEYPAALKGMDKLVKAPSYGVTQQDVNIILQMKMWLEYPQFREPPLYDDDGEKYQKFLSTERPVFVENEKGLVHELCEVLPTKLPDAAKITEGTVDRLTENKFMGVPSCQ
jgi:hypothetical protein